MPTPLGNLERKRYDELDSETKDRIGAFPLSVFEIQQADEVEIRELFQRLQEGTSLNPAERRNALTGGVRDFVATTAGSDDDSEPHGVLSLTRLSNRRFQWDDLVALVTCLELAEGPTNIKAPDLRRMYRDNHDFRYEGSQARSVLTNLNYLARVLKEQPPEMDIKWGFVDLYLLVSKLRTEYDLRKRETDIADFYVTFEQERREVQDEGILAATSDQWDKDLFDYIQNFKTGGGERAAVETRHGVYLRRFLFVVGDLVPKDPRRSYNHSERLVIWRRANGKCDLCHQEVTLDNMQADHRIPHAAGGSTTVSNGQCLCGPCNWSKSASNSAIEPQ